MSRPAKKFHQRYCAGHLDEEEHWVADGSSNAEELASRLNLLMIKRTRAEVWKGNPAKTREVIYIENEDKNDKPIVEGTVDLQLLEKNMYQALDAALQQKTAAILDAVGESIGCKEKVIIWVATRNAVEILTTEAEKLFSSREYSAIIRQNNLRLWAVHGETPEKVRDQVCQQFVEHDGAAVIIATMQSLPESVSLFGATIEHYAQLHWLPMFLAQSENRPLLEASTKVHIVYWILRKSRDERILSLVLPRLEQVDATVKDQDAAGLAGALKRVSPKEEKTLLERLCVTMEDDLTLMISDTEMFDVTSGGT